MKTPILVTVATTAMTLLSSGSAVALSFNFYVREVTGDPFFQGTFTGQDLNSDNRLSLQELKNFQALFVPRSVSFSKDNLNNFEYILGTTSSIFLSVSKRVDLFNELADYAIYDLGIKGVTSYLSVEYYQNDRPLLIEDGPLNSPVLVESIPEPVTLLGAATAVLMGAVFKKTHLKK